MIYASKLTIWALMVTLSLLAFTGPALANALGNHDSPYLAMHGDDPVAWHAWSAEVLARAKKENKLLFVSIGYFACHWCHVMQRETYRDSQVAKLLNEHFISVKVDRELNPALDAYLIDFVQRTRGVAGWPLNVFLTPEGHPLVGLTYAPKDRFFTLLSDLQQQWQQAPLYLAQTAAKAAATMKGEAARPDPALKPGDGQRYETLLVQQALHLSDEMDGGFGEQSKFPMVPQLDALLSAYAHDARPLLKDFLSRLIVWPRRECVITWGVVFFVTPLTLTGRRHTLKKCCTTMHCWPGCICVLQQYSNGQIMPTLPGTPSILC